MTFKKKDYYPVIEQAKDLVAGFRESFRRFEERVVLDRLSPSLVSNYGRNVALHFNRIPHQISIEELNAFLYRKSVHEGLSESYFKQTVFGLRFWFRLFGMEASALQLPVIRKEKKLPQVLSKEECKALFKAPRTLKHRFLLAFAYSSGLRMNELRHLKISDVDEDLINCKYFHAVFTLPQVLNPFCLLYPQELYEMLFQASKDTLNIWERRWVW